MIQFPIFVAERQEKEMKIELEDSEKEKIVRDVMEGFPEYSSPSLVCTDWKYQAMQFMFREDTEDPLKGDVIHQVNLEMLKKGLDKMVLDIAAGRIHTSGNIGLQDMLADTGNWDANDADNLVQYAIFGEVIYG